MRSAMIIAVLPNVVTLVDYSQSIDWSNLIIALIAAISSMFAAYMASLAARS